MWSLQPNGNTPGKPDFKLPDFPACKFPPDLFANAFFIHGTGIFTHTLGLVFMVNVKKNILYTIHGLFGEFLFDLILFALLQWLEVLCTDNSWLDVT